MTLTEFAVKKRYTTIAATLAIILLGLGGYMSLETQLNPDIDPVVVNVTTTYQGAAPSDIAELINEPLTEELGTIAGVENISAQAMEGSSIITVEFNYDKNIDVAAVEVQNVINRIRGELPAEINSPQVKKFSPADKPVVTVGITGDYNLTYLRTIATNKISQKLQLVSGVASVDVFGGHKREIYISVDQERLKTYNLSLSSIVAKLNQENVTIPGGRITKVKSEYLVRTVGEYKSLTPIKNLVVGNYQGQLIYLRNVAQVIDSYQDLRSRFRLRGKEAVAINIIKQQTANTVQVASRIKDELKKLRVEYPKLKFTVTDDQSNLVKIVINNLTSSLRLGIILTMILIFLFLNNWRNTLAISISIPLTFLLTLALLKVFGLTLNSTTMTGLILAIGMLVDDSIVVIENITRHFEELKRSPSQAAIEGTNEIALATVAGSTTSMIVLLPIMFIGGFVQQMFRPLAMTLLFAWTGSLITALTIIPLIMTLVLKRKQRKKDNFIYKVVNLFGKAVDYSRDIYLKLLKVALAYRGVVIVLGISLLVISISLMPLIGSTMVPKMDSGQIYISIEAEPGSSLTKTTWITRQVEEIIKEIPEVQIYSSQIGAEPGSGMSSVTGAMGVQQSFISVDLSSSNQRTRSIWEIEAEIRNKMSQIPGIRAFVVREIGSTAIATTKAPLVVRLKGDNPMILRSLAQQLVPQLKKVPGATNITTTWTIASPEYQIKVDRIKAAKVGLTTKGVASQVTAAVKGIETAQDYSLSGKKDISIRVRYQREDRKNKQDLKDIMITTPLGTKIALRELATIKLVKGPNLITSENLVNTLDIIGYTHNRALSKITADLQQIIDQFKLPEDYQVSIAGERNDLVEARDRLMISLAFAVVFVYLLLVSQFKSALHPLTIMLSIPLELIGVVGGLILTGKYLSMPAIMGLILLTGIAVNDAIHLIEFAIEEQNEGKSPQEALLTAAKLRFRPIIMTTLSTDVGMLPLALELSVGSEKYSPLAIVVIGGLTASTLLLLFVVPAVYSLVEDLKSTLLVKNN
ncbi:cation/multidrug efflux pump [Halobacteroides halobius DSM 5150]|uniref:Cation/multidrug efflux pump n=1 Tax=Halobacteroides halobius (strain ATCC 35273 / DSM 5150 / MD-1) TaxID=748449 RepID=L0K7B4_HALHC|nr:efflux RND transporter permease subunit [Halobacteroides halobius]AGB41177.1 cation/multidrug efflux pump [Halobacteroides halobius DSM 5150]